jgi:hypothetical protein
MYKIIITKRVENERYEEQMEDYRNDPYALENVEPPQVTFEKIVFEDVFE